MGTPEAATSLEQHEERVCYVRQVGVGSTDPLVVDWDRMGYPTWQVANAQQWTALLQATMRGKSLADILVEAGMSRTDKIILHR